MATRHRHSTAQDARLRSPKSAIIHHPGEGSIPVRKLTSLTIFKWRVGEDRCVVPPLRYKLAVLQIPQESHPLRSDDWRPPGVDAHPATDRTHFHRKWVGPAAGGACMLRLEKNR